MATHLAYVSSDDVTADVTEFTFKQLLHDSSQSADGVQLGNQSRNKVYGFNIVGRLMHADMQHNSISLTLKGEDLFFLLPSVDF